MTTITPLEIKAHLTRLCGAYNRAASDAAIDNMFRGWGPVLDGLDARAVKYAFDTWSAREARLPVAAEIAKMARESPYHVKVKRDPTPEERGERCEDCHEWRAWHRVVSYRDPSNPGLVLLDHLRHRPGCPFSPWSRRYMAAYCYEWADSLAPAGVTPLMGEAWRLDGVAQLINPLPPLASTGGTRGPAKPERASERLERHHPIPATIGGEPQ